MNHPHPGPPGPHPGHQSYAGHPQPGPPYPGQQAHPGQAHPGQAHPGQPYPGQAYTHQAYPGQGPYPGQAPYPSRPNKALPVLAALLFLPNVILLYVASFPVVADGRVSTPHLGFSLLGLPFTEDITGNIDFAVSLSLSVASTVLVLAVVLACRVPGVRWGLVGIAVLAAAHGVYVVVELVSELPGEFVVLPAIALVLWLVSGLVAALPPVGRALRGATPAAPPPIPRPQPPARWG